MIRNLVTGMQFIQDHVIHFYHLHALDWVDVVSALKADPAAAGKIASSHLAVAQQQRRRTSRRVQERLQEVRGGAGSSASSRTATGAIRRTSCRRR